MGIARLRRGIMKGVSARLKSRPLVSLGAIIVMAIVLIASVAVFLFFDGSNTVHPGNTGVEKGPLNLEVTYIPKMLRSGMQDEITGIVTDEEGRPIPDALVTLNFTSDPDDTYRTKTGPDGSFSLPFWSPVIEENSTFNFNIEGRKDGYGEMRMPLEIEIITPLDWTIMVYMSDCDLESSALEDINEMEKIPSGPHLDLVVQLDRWESLSPKDDRSDGNWTSARRYLVQPDTDPLSITSKMLQDKGEINTADPMELVDFTMWAMENYPADRYALILWNHGSGIEGICWEQSMETDEVISIKELGEAMDIITDGGARPLDILGFDACLMSTIEVAYEVAPFCRYMIGSEITEPAFGWDYFVLGDLVMDPFLSEEELGSSIIGGYIAQTDLFSSKRSLSMGLYDLTLADEAVSDLDALSNTINSAGTAEIYNMRVARKYAQPISDGHSSDAVDLKDYVENILDLSSNPDVKRDALDLISSLDNMVIRFEKVQGLSDIDTEGLNGLSIYSPDFKEVLDANEDHDDLKFTKDTTWTQTLLSYYENMEMHMEDRMISFDEDQFSCKVKDQDGDFLPDTMEYRFAIVSSADDADVFLGINVYKLGGEYVNSTWMTFNISSLEKKDFTIRFRPTGEGRESGMYRIVAYLCLGPKFDPLMLQDYTRSGYRWLEVS